MRIDLQNAILLVLCLVLLLSVFTLSANASPSDFFELTYSMGKVSIGNSKVDTNSPYPIYLAHVGSPDNTLYVFFTDPIIKTNGYSASLYRSGGGVTGINAFFSSATLSGTVYYKAFNGSIPDGASAVPYFATLADALSAFSAEPVIPSPLEYSLPPGNVAYIPIPSGQSSAITYTLTTTYYMAFGNNDTSRINQVVTVMSSLPSSTNNTAPSAPKIPWTNNGNVNLLGVSANKIYQGSIPANYGGQYLVVVNPMTMPSQTGLIGGDTYTNGSINISVSAVSGSPYIYPMSESLTITPGDGIGSESSYGDSGYTYEIDPETGEIIWTDPEGGSSAPVAGGNNPMPSPNTIFDWLRNISQQFSDFLRGPVQAVQVVVSAIRDFLGSFTQLYQWLPSPVYSLITSALMIALTIGVIKIFV